MRKVLVTAIFLSLTGWVWAQEDSIQIEDYYLEELDSIGDDFSIELEETVVVGYGTQKRGDLTSSVSSVKAEDIMSQPATTAMQSLQGKLAGVNIVNTDQPGGTPSVIIRGLGTALGGRNPLYVVDGLIVPNIMNINPNDIETIDVMKDAASSSIYGVRGANGVVIVTTKRGKKGKPRINYDAYMGYRNILNKVDMANSSQYVTYFNEEQAILGSDKFLSSNQPYDTDWYDELLKTGFINNNSLSIAGGGEGINYFFAMDHFDEKGILEGQNFNRTTIRNNNDYRLFDDRITIKQNISISFTNETPKPMSAFNTAFRQAPIVPVRYDNGRWGGSYWNQTTGIAGYTGAPDDVIGSLNNAGNPVSQVYHDNVNNKTTTLQGNLEIGYEIIDNLTFTTRAGGTKYWYTSEVFVPTRDLWLAADPRRELDDFIAEQENPGNSNNVGWANNSFSREEINTTRWQWENYLTYDLRFDNHSLTLVGGMSAEEIGVGSRFYGKAYNVPDQSNFWSLDLANSGDQTYDKVVEQYNYTPLRFLSYFGRVQYDFDKKYYLSAVFRRDGTSVFRTNNEYWGNFPSFSAGWTISNEEFLKDSNFLNFLKLIGGWCRLGNSDVAFIITNTISGPTSENYNYVFGPGQDLIFGAYYGSPAVPISWEIVEEWGGGIDFTLLDNKLSGTFDYYNKTTENMILNVTPILSGPYSTDYYDHAAEVVNKGWEASLAWKNTSSSGDFRYEIGVNFNMNDNEVVSVIDGYEGMTGGSLGNGAITKRLEEGLPIGSWWMYEVQGVWQTQEEIDNNPHITNAKPGHLRYVDQNGDGVIDQRDKKFFGSYLPTYNYGINISLAYKNVDFNISGYGAGGNEIYNGLMNTRWGGENITEETFNNRWTGPGSTNEHPGANRDYEASNYYLEDGDFFRINNITLGYNLKGVINGVHNLRLYVTAQNPFIFTKYSGFSPELNGTGIDAGNPYRLTGIELDAYPTTRTFLMGVNVEF